MTCADSFRGWPQLRTLCGARVSLRSFAVDDLTPTYVAWLNDTEVVRFSNQRFRHHDMASCSAYLAEFNGSDNLFLAIDGLVESRVIGTMTAYRNRHHSTVDIGIMVGDRGVWGRGYGLEAWVLLSDWLLGIGGMRKLTCGTLACNHAMRSIAERSGMVLEATRYAQEIVAGEPQDILYYARFRGDS